MSWQDAYKSMPLTPIVQPPQVKEPDVGCQTPLDLEEYLPIDMIRVHAKIDDIPSATDEQLAGYRKAAMEAAEQYTGMLLNGTRPIEEIIDHDWSPRDFRHGYVKYILKYPSSDGIVYLYGCGSTDVLHTQPNSSYVRIPIGAATLNMAFNDCCRGPCDQSDARSTFTMQLKLLYRSGFKSWDDIPEGIRLGMLKFIAWCVTHPGDEIIAVRNRNLIRSSLVDGTNNVAWASGALELWHQYVDDLI